MPGSVGRQLGAAPTCLSRVIDEIQPLVYTRSTDARVVSWNSDWDRRVRALGLLRRRTGAAIKQFAAHSALDQVPASTAVRGGDVAQR